MSNQFTITITGEDQPQLVNRLAALTHDFDGKWLNSKISRLENQVVGIIKIEVPSDKASQLKTQLQHFTDLNILFAQNEHVPTSSKTQHLLLKVEATDRLGLISDLSGALFNMGASINHIENQRLPITELGQVMFFAELSIDVMDEVNPQQLIDAVQLIDDNIRLELVS